MVKKIFILITALAATLSAVAQEDSVATAIVAPALGNEQIWDEANTAYVNANYPRAIELYHSIEDQGLASAKLYYNMGNAYFKTDDMGHAILYYNKALRLSPGDQDIRYNLDVANSYTKDRIQVVPELFLTRWIRSVRQTISGNAWAVLSLVFFAVMLVAVMAYMLVNSLLFRKIGFFATIVSLLLFVITTSFAVTERRHATSPTEAIVMRASVSVKAAPEKNSTDMFVLHEGTKVRVGNSVEGWIEVTIADGNKGWLEERTIEMID